MPGSTTRAKTRNRDSIVFNALDIVPFTSISPAISQTPALIADAINLPTSCKIMGASVYYTSITAPDGTFAFNIVAGTGTYETVAGSHATNFATVSGAVQTGDVVKFIFTVPQILLTQVGGVTQQPGLLGFPPVAGSQQIPFTYTVLATDTTASILATSIAASFNAHKNAISNVIYAYMTGGAQIHFTTLQSGNTINVPALPTATDENAITSVVSVQTNPTPGSPAATTVVTMPLAFAGATNTTGVVFGVNDQFEYTGAYNFAPAGAGTLSATPIFSSDMPIFQNVPGGNCYWSSNFDVIYQQGTTLTLRVTTPGAGAVVGLKVTLLLMAFDVLVPNPTFFTFDVHNDIG